MTPDEEVNGYRPSATAGCVCIVVKVRETVLNRSYECLRNKKVTCRVRIEISP